MQRSVGTLALVSHPESPSPGSPPSDDDLIFESITSESITSESTYAACEPLLTHLPDSLHNPLHCGDPTLLGIALSDIPLISSCCGASGKLNHSTR